jgi:hypothetical protein
LLDAYYRDPLGFERVAQRPNRPLPAP